MKKKILLKTLIPLTTVGISLGTALPLVSCSCGGGENHGDIHLFYTWQDSLDFTISTINASLNPADCIHDWSTKPADFPEMIEWFNTNIDSQILMLLLVTTYTYALSPMMTFPIEYTYNSDSKIASVTLELFAPEENIIFMSLSKNASGFEFTSVDNTQTQNGVGAIDKVWAASESGESGGRIIELSTLDTSVNLLPSWNILPNIQFPLVVPDS